MPVLAAISVLPLHRQVALVDSTWQDYPQWETGEEEVVFRAPSLVDPDNPPYPGFAVATRADFDRTEVQDVMVELWTNERPAGMHLLHESILAVGRGGVAIGNGDSGLTQVDLPRGRYPIKVFVDETDRARRARVVFAIRAE